MASKLLYYACILFNHLGFFVIRCLALNQENVSGIQVLNIGEELFRETLPLNMGDRCYQIRGLKPSMWYEVKISYPASIPACFSIQLKRGKADIRLSRRKLLNTEKLIFKADTQNLSSGHSEMYVLVAVEPAGIVALPHAHERELVTFNIVCDELSFGIPHKAWWVGILAFLCMGIAVVVPKLLPPYLLLKNQSLQSRKSSFSKAP